MKRHTFTLELRNDPASIAEYERIHQGIWPDIAEKIRASGIIDMQIFRWENRMFMLMDTTDDFSLEAKAAADATDPRVQEWEAFMWTFQQALPGAAPGQKWVEMKQIFKL